MTAPPGYQQKRVRLCLKDLYSQDVVEMIERETRKYELWSIESAEDPHFKRAYDLLWSAFGDAGEMEREEAVREFFARNQYEPTKDGTFIRYFLILAKDREGNIRGARDGSVLINPAYSPDLCVVYLSHIFMVPEARGSVLTYWLRIAPVEIAMQYIADLMALGKFTPPQPNAPGKNYGMRLNMTAEMEYFSPEDRLSLQRILFYGRGGFDVINPRHFPYRQPDFRDPEEIAQTGNHPVPFMILVRRIGREKQATLPIAEARAIMNLLYDDFECHCSPEFLDNSLQIVLDRLEERAKTKSYVELLPLPTGSKDLHRLKRLFRYNVYRRYYKNDPATREYMQEMGAIVRKNPNYLNDELARIANDLDARGAPIVYGTRDKDFTWDGLPIDPPRVLPVGYADSGELPIVDDTPSGLIEAAQAAADAELEAANAEAAARVAAEAKAEAELRRKEAEEALAAAARASKTMKAAEPSNRQTLRAAAPAKDVDPPTKRSS